MIIDEKQRVHVVYFCHSLIVVINKALVEQLDLHKAICGLKIYIAAVYTDGYMVTLLVFGSLKICVELMDELFAIA